MKTNILYKVNEIKPDRNNQLHVLFSGMKLGDKDSIKEMGELFIKKIKNEINISKLDNYIIVNSPSTVAKLTSIYYVADYIAKKLSIPHIKIMHKSLPYETHYYLDLSPKERKIYHQSTFYYRGKSLKNKKIIVIDDVLASGVVLSATKRVLLQHGAKDIYSFVFMKIKLVPTSIEKELSLTNLIRNKDYIIDLLNNKKGVITTRIMSYILLSPPKEARRILDKINNQVRKNLLKALSDYTHKDGFMMKKYVSIFGKPKY